MTPEQRYDRWERIAKLLYEAATRSSRESRKHNAKLKFLLEANRQHDAAMLTAAANPESAEMRETVDRTGRILKQAREDLKR